MSRDLSSLITEQSNWNDFPAFVGDKDFMQMVLRTLAEMMQSENANLPFLQTSRVSSWMDGLKTDLSVPVPDVQTT